MGIGIYTIENISTKQLYVGSSIDFKRRWATHKRLLRRNKHENEYLQLSWNKYGEESFVFDILVECDQTLLASEENYWCNLLRVHNRKFGYNMKVTHPYGKNIITDEIREKIRQKCLGRKWSEEYIQLFKECKLGKKQTEEHIKKAAKGRYKKVYQYDKNNNFIKEWPSATVVQRELNINATTIGNCCNKVKHFLTAGGFKWSYSKI